MPRWTGGAKETAQQLIAIEFLAIRKRSNRAGARWQSADSICDNAAARAVWPRHGSRGPPGASPARKPRWSTSLLSTILVHLSTQAPAKKPRAPKPANDLDQANARIVELEEELKSARSLAPVTDVAEHAAEPTDRVVTTVDLQAYLEKRVNADAPSIPSTGSP
jgi:hypothetical protein